MGSGYSVEGQITGKEKFGGLQIEVIPSYRRHLKMWELAPKPGEPEQVDCGYHAEYLTPEKLGLRPFDKLRTYSNLQVPLKIPDLAQRISSDQIRLYEFDSSHAADEPSYDGDELMQRWGASYNPPIVPKVPNSPQDLCDDLVGGGSDVDDETSMDSLQGNDEFDYHQVLHKARMLDRRSDNNSRGRPGCKYYYDPGTSMNSHAVGNDNSDYHHDNHEPRAFRRKTRNLRAMGLSAGGKMIQDIVRDHNHATNWNVHNATLMNVHILDPASCE